jgi:hypothetical protein
MGWFLQHLFRSRTNKVNAKKLSSYDTTRAETSTPQNIREGNEPEAIRQRLEKGKGNENFDFMM